MKIKAADIAKELNLSKATVSLALNNKPGVSEQTKAAVYQCRERLEKQYAARDSKAPALVPTIRIVTVTRNLDAFHPAEMDLWSEVLRTFDREAKKNGYILGVDYTDTKPENVRKVTEGCNSPEVAGVIVVATEMQADDASVLGGIHKPLVIYDNDLGADYHCVTIDNSRAVMEAVDYLAEHRCADIRYLRHKTDLYNFMERRSGFRAGLRRHNILMTKDSVILTGTNIESVKEYMMDYFRKESFADAYICENFQVSIGTALALHELGISVPKSFSLIGIDEVPFFMTAGLSMTTMKVPHAERAEIAMMFLMREIEEEIPVKFKSMARCRMSVGDTVKSI